MNQALVCQGITAFYLIITAFYLIVGGATIEANTNLGSKIIFKATPLVLGIWMAFNTFAQYKGWPV